VVTCIAEDKCRVADRVNPPAPHAERISAIVAFDIGIFFLIFCEERIEGRLGNPIEVSQDNVSVTRKGFATAHQGLTSQIFKGVIEFPVNANSIPEINLELCDNLFSGAITSDLERISE